MVSNCPWHIDSQGIKLLSQHFFSKEGPEAVPVLNSNKEGIFAVEKQLGKKAGTIYLFNSNTIKNITHLIVVLCPPGLTDVLSKAAEIAPVLTQLKKIQRIDISWVLLLQFVSFKKFLLNHDLVGPF